MRSEPKFVFDTNVILSAMLSPRSITRQALDQATDRRALLISEPVVGEFRDVLRRKRFDRYISEVDRLRFLADIVQNALLIEITQAIEECRDPKDDKFLELAVEGEATCLVTGDDDLLTLGPFRGIPIVTPREFLSHYGPNPDA